MSGSIQGRGRSVIVVVVLVVDCVVHVVHEIVHARVFPGGGLSVACLVTVDRWRGKLAKTKTNSV